MSQRRNATRRRRCLRIPKVRCSVRRRTSELQPSDRGGCRRRDRAVQLPPDPLDPGRGARARAGQRRRSEARHPDRGVRRCDARGRVRGRRAAERRPPDAARRRRRRRGARRRPHTRVIAFTGSTSAGRKVGEAAGAHLTRVHLELGGNNALIVLPDADLDQAASAGAGRYLHQGQICMAAAGTWSTRSLPTNTWRRSPRRPSACPSATRTTGEVALGPIIDAVQRDNIHRLVTESVSAGVTLVEGGTHDGLFYRPTVLDHVQRDTPAFCPGSVWPRRSRCSATRRSTRPSRSRATPSTDCR